MVRAVRKNFAAEYQQHELNEFATDVDASLKQVTEELRPEQPGQVLTDEVVALKFGVLNRLFPRAAGMVAQLPRPAVGELTALVMSAAGTVTFAPTGGALVNGAASYAPTAAIAVRRFVCDGTGWWV